ncbi:prolyl 4-hydroxylase subunit alpha-2-like isoform X1 [Ornithodoros turicata]|uniref:prolyl 4-hydroxylase subunit alpha-2-like isoform X1 n=2 Tax=Ornithodoros turicata TaxID=34597 RepID=UPI003139C5D9
MPLHHSSRTLLQWTCMFLFVAPFCYGQFQRDFYSSVSALSDLVKFEKEVKVMLLVYIENLKALQQTLLQYVNSEKIYEGLKTDEAVEQHMMHPIHAFHLAKRMTVQLGAVESHIHRLRAYDPMINITAMRHHRMLPWEEDFHGMAASIVRLQDTYLLNMTQLADGLLKTSTSEKGIKGQQALSGRDCFFIGKVAFQTGFFDRAVEWFEEALERTESEQPPSLRKEEVQPFYDNAIKKHDEVLETKGKAGQNWQTYGVPVSERRQRSTEFQAKLFDDSISQVLEVQQFKRLCRGENIRSAKLNRHLRCRYYFGKHPFLRFNPVKLEELNLKPYVAVMHGVIQEKDINDLLAFAKPRLKRSTHFGGRGSVASGVRTSSNAWLGDEDADVAVRLNTFLGDLLGLGTRFDEQEAEKYQLANYGIGGQYLSHIDFLQTSYNLPNVPVHDFERGAGDRVATLMVYLTDVAEGGATVFPHLGLRIEPKKGDAAFWWNLKTDGEGEQLATHGGCPVLFGTKWIANKWFRTNCNMFRLPCGKNSTDSLAPL